MVDVGWKTIGIAFVVAIVVPLSLSMWLFSSLPEPIFLTLLLYEIIITVIGAVSFLALVMIMPWRTAAAFPIQVMIHEQCSGNVIQIKLDRARQTAKGQDGKYTLKLKNTNSIIQSISHNYFEIFGNGKKFLNLFKTQEGVYHPITIHEVDGLVPIPENMRYFVGEQIRRNYERHFKKFGAEKFIPIGMVVVTGIILIMVLYMGFGKWNEGMQTMNSIAASQADVTHQISELLGQINSLLGRGGITLSNLTNIPMPPSPVG